MSLIVDSAMLREPLLLSPQRKPIGRVEVDWTHPLANGLEDIFLHRSLDERSLTGRRIPTGVGGTEKSNNLSFNGTQYRNISTTGMHTGYPRSMLSWALHNGNTIYLLSQAYSGASQDYFALILGGSGTGYYYHREQDGPANWSQSGGTSILGRVSFLAGVSSSSSNHKLYTQGNLVSTETGTYNPSGLDRYTVGALRDLTPSYSGGGVVVMNMLFSRALLSGEIKSLYNDPYQFLIPA